MSKARAHFVQRLRDLKSALDDESTQDGTLNDTQRNAKARILRNGLAVVAFCSLEDFIRQRTGEICRAITSIGIAFSHLPEKLAERATVELLKTISFQAKLQTVPDRLAFVQKQARILASTATTPYEISELSFGFDKSNINVEDITLTLSSFCIDNPWQNIGSLAARVNLGALDLCASFRSAAARRHQGAHEAAANIPHGNLTSWLTEARAIGIGFDVLISRAFTKLRSEGKAYVNGAKLKHSDCEITFFYESNSVWKEKRQGKRSARASHTDKNALLTATRNRAVKEFSAIVMLDPSGQADVWEFPCVP